MFQKTIFIILSMWVLAACRPPSPPLPGLTPQTGCQDVLQCVWAIRLDRCCDCGGIYTLQQVENDPRLLLSSQRYDYNYPVERIQLPDECQNVVCAPCMEPPFGLLCEGGNCREPETAAEILSICPNVSDPLYRERCPAIAAAVALDQQGPAEAVEICNQIPGSGQDGLPLRETCILDLSRTIMSQPPILTERPDPWTAVDLCRTELTDLEGICLYESAQVISQTEFEPALQLCESISTDDEYNLWQRHACFDYLAYLIAPTDYDRAVSLCQRSMELEESCLDKIRSPR